MCGMRKLRVVAAAVLLASCSVVTKDARRMTGEPRGPSDASASSTDDAGSTTTSAPDSRGPPIDAGAPTCPLPASASPPNGWVEQKISLGVANHGFYSALAGDDARIAVAGAAPSTTRTYSDTAVFLYRRTGQSWQPDG